MTSLQSQGSFAASYGAGRENVKTRTKATVKPVLKKLRQSSRHPSDKDLSLDLDLSWDEQPAIQRHHDHHNLDHNYPLTDKDEILSDGPRFSSFGGVSGLWGADTNMVDFSLDAASERQEKGKRHKVKSARDVSFSLKPTDLSNDGYESVYGGVGSGSLGSGWLSGRSHKSASSRSVSTATAATTAAATTTIATNINNHHHNKNENGTLGSTASSNHSAPPSAQAYFASSSHSHSHTRSASGISHLSTSTTGSGRNGSFVHPFQQTPRTSEPPLMHTNSFTSLEQVASAARDSSREYSLSLTREDEDAAGFTITATTTLTTASTGSYRNSLSDLKSQTSLSRPYDSSPDLVQPGKGNTAGRSSFGTATRPLEPLSSSDEDMNQDSLSNTLTTTTTTPTTATTISTATVAYDSRRAEYPFPPKIDTTSVANRSAIPATASTTSPNQGSDMSSPTADTPLTFPTSISPGAGVTPLASASQTHHSKGFHLLHHSRTNSQTGTCHSPSSVTAPLRSSLDMASFRLRSRSEVDTAARQEQIREARRRFDEKEKAKDEEHFRRQQRKIEKAEDRAAAKVLGTDKHGAIGGRRSATFGTRGSASLDQRRPAATPRSSAITTGSPGVTGRTTSADTTRQAGAAYSTHRQADGVQFQAAPKRRKTSGSWTNFTLWLRVKIFRLGKR